MLLPPALLSRLIYPAKVTHACAVLPPPPRSIRKVVLANKWKSRKQSKNVIVLALISKGKQSIGRGLCGAALSQRLARYNHNPTTQVGSSLLNLIQSLDIYDL